MSSTTPPTYESLRNSGQLVRPSIDFLRLRWYLSGPISTKIQVLASAFDATSPQSPYQQSPCPDSDSDDSLNFHPISASPVSHPPVSSVTVTSNLLDGWPSSWDDEHYHCVDMRERVVTLPDGTEQLVRCCGTDRPGPGPSLTVTAGSASPGSEFVTIHDYVTAVHPWLLAHEGVIRDAIGSHPKAPLRAEFEVFVYSIALSPLFLQNTKAIRGENREAWWARLARDAEKWVAEGQSREYYHSQSDD